MVEDGVSQGCVCGAAPHFGGLGGVHGVPVLAGLLGRGGRAGGEPLELESSSTARGKKDRLHTQAVRDALLFRKHPLLPQLLLREENGSGWIQSHRQAWSMVHLKGRTSAIEPLQKSALRD